MQRSSQQHHPVSHSILFIMLTVIYCEQNLLFVHPDHLCFYRTTYDNINGPGGPFMFDIIGPAGPLMYPDQIFRYRSIPNLCFKEFIFVHQI